MSKKIVVGGFVGVALVLLVFGAMQPVSAAWTKIAPIHINNTGGNAQAYYPVRLLVPYDSDMNNDFSDLRVVENETYNFIPYWIENKSDGEWCVLWFNATYIPANSWCNDTYYLLYGNASASDASDGDATFEFFDDFNPIQGNKFEDFERYENNPLSIPQYSSDGVVHPDVLYFPDGMDGYKYWMVYTPYPPESTEDPSIVRSNDGINWTDTGISNPVIPNGGESWRNNHQHDPDFLYVPQYSKWFMVWGGVNTSGDASIAFAYSSDGKNWTEYDGTAVNGNTNPVILNGNDNGGQSWERDGDGKSRVTVPTLFFDTSENKFYLFYGEVISGNNRGKVGYATFTWNNDTNNIENFQRYSGNPIIDLPQDSEFKSGCGHLDISYYNGTYYMYVVREILSSTNYELCLLTSTDKINWVCKGKVLERGSGWESKHIYRSSPVTDGVGNIITFSGDIKLYYSAFDSSDISKIGLAYGKEEINKLDTDKWTRTSQFPSVSVANSILTLKGEGLSEKTCGKGTELSWSGGYAARARVALKEDYSFIFFSSTSDDIDVSANQSMVKRYSGDDHFFSTVGDGTNFAHVFSTIQKDANYHIMEMRRTASTAEAVIDNESWFNNDYAANDEKYLWIAARGTTSGTEVDWILVRKYADSEPTALLGAEQNIGTGCTAPTITSLTNSTPTTNSVTITWTTNQSADNRVKYSKNSDLSNPLWSSWDNDTTSVSITLTGLEANTTYYYQAWSYNGTNSSCYTVEPSSQPYRSFTTQSSSSSYTITLEQGYNMIGWTSTTSKTSSELCSIIPNCTYVYKKNPDGSWTTKHCGYPGGDFSVSRGFGFLAYITQQCEWTRDE